MVKGAKEMQIDRVRCLFEQSGTFKDEFAKFGIIAYDYDIRNDFKKTDYQVNLFKQIALAYSGQPSIFDKFSSEDLLFAFFPCVRFSKLFVMSLNCTANEQSKWSVEKKVAYSMAKMDEVNEYYRLISELVIVCFRKGLRLIIENPYSSNHFLTRYFPIKPSIIDMDRTLFGDDFKKPTQYWFVNCVPENNLNFGFCLDYQAAKKKVLDLPTVERSMISPTYAYNFIRDFIITQ